MEKTLLWEAFFTLTAPEVRDFGLFVRSPFFNKKPALVALCDYLARCHQQKEVPTAPEMAAALGGKEMEKSADNQRLRLANSALLALLEHFWMYREKFAAGDRAKIRLAAAYRKRGLDKHFRIALREAGAGRQSQPYRHADYFHDLNLIEWERYQHSAASRRTEALNLQETSDLMDLAFAARKLRLACIMRSHETMYKADYQVGLLDDVLALAERHLDEPALGLYYHCYRFLTGEEGEAARHFEAFQHMLLPHAQAFPPDELRSLYLLAINFGIRRLNAGTEGWLRATLGLYQSALALGLLLENGRLSRFAFNNIAGIAVRVGELDWAEQFILENKALLERQHREGSASLNLARIAYVRRDFKTALLQLQRADYRDLLNNLIAKTLQLKIYFETEEWDLLTSHLASMSNFIRRHTAIGYHRTNYSRIVHYTRALMTLQPGDLASAAALRAQVENEPTLTEKEWLLDMLK